MAPFEEVAHTADVALRVWAPTLEGLFVEAATGLIELMGCEPAEDSQPVRREIALQADDLETLLVDWLSEILFLAEHYQECYDEFEIADMGPTQLRAEIRGWTSNRIAKEIKAVTYSGLDIIRGAHGYEAVVTFDV